jgi:hypothetical protein
MEGVQVARDADKGDFDFVLKWYTDFDAYYGEETDNDAYNEATVKFKYGPPANTEFDSMIELTRIYEASTSQYLFSMDEMVNAGELTIRGMPENLMSCQFELPTGSYIDGSGFVMLSTPKSGF